MKLYNKPELNVEKFDVEDVIANEGSIIADKDFGDNSFGGGQSAGMEFDITADGNEF